MRWAMTETAPPEDDFELPVGGFQGTPEEIERQWFEKVYKGRGDSMAQLTWRAVIMGSLLGRRPVADESLHRSEVGLGLRRGDHGLHPLLRALDEPLSHRAGRLADDDLGEQLHAVGGQFGRLFDGRNAHFGICGLYDVEPRPSLIAALHVGLGFLLGGVWGSRWRSP